MPLKRFAVTKSFVMKLALLHLALFTAVIISYAQKTDPQLLLNKPVSITVEQKEIKEVVILLEKQTGTKFTYSSDVIKISRKISCSVNNIKLVDFLEKILGPLKIDYKVIDEEQILLLVKPSANNLNVSPINAITTVIFSDFIIKGVVKDEIGNPLPDVSVQVKNGTATTITNKEGKYSIKVTDNKVTLLFSCVSYITVERGVTNSKNLDVVLKQVSAVLDDVVVIGYGDKSKKKLTTAVASIKSEDVNDLPVGTLGDALAANAAGVEVSSAFGGQPGESPTIRIRGIGSLGTDNSPLYVVDGYPLQSESNFANINPADIESIEILKDAASGAIYGSRAANGVIIVTTKRGKSGKTKFNVSYLTGFQQITQKVDVINREEFIDYENKLIKERGNANSYSKTLNDTLGQLGTTDWQDAIFRNSAYSEAKISANGGNDKVKYAISGGYLNQSGVLLGTGAKRYTLRINLDADLTTKLKLGISLAPSYIEQDRRPNGGNFNTSSDGEYGVVVPSPIYTSLLLPAVIPLKLPDGRYGQPNFFQVNDLFNNGMFNPVAVLQSLTNHNTNFRTLSNGYLEWKIINGLKLKSSVGATVDFNRREVYVSAETPTASSQLASFLNPNPNGIYAAETSGRNIDWLLENTINYTKSFNNKHNIKVLLLQSAQKFSGNINTTFGRTGSYTTNIIQNPSASADNSGLVNYDVFTFSSLAARLSYDFKSKYLLDASIRRDGSSKFGSNNRFGSFSSIAFAWRLGEEPFIKKIKAISDLKFRVSYGQSGNANIGSFSWQNQILSINSNYGSTTRQFGTVPAGYLNPDLTWEKNVQFNLGIDFSLFNNRVNVTADYYNKVTTDMILNKQLLSIVGYAFSYNNNTGSLRNRGYEIAINTKNIVGKKFQWNTSFNLSHNDNLVTDLGGADNLGFFSAATGWNNVFLIKVGQPIGDFYGFQVDGIFKNAAEAATAPKYGGSNTPVAAGDMKISDVNGDGQIDVNDRTIIGNARPDFILGMTNRFNYKSFDLSFVMQAQIGGNIINATERNAWGTPGANLPRQMYYNTFLRSDPEADVKYPSVASKAPITFVNSLTSLVVYDATFLRLRNITLGYNFQNKLLKKAGLQSARLYLASQNLFTIASYPGYNPEVSLNGNSITQPGVDQGVYPQVKNFIIGFNVGF